jgi:hypothetical protein
MVGGKSSPVVRIERYTGRMLYWPQSNTIYEILLRFLFQGLTMASSDAFALRGSGLNEFLFASVGTEPNGVTLNLLSVFARRGDDPWKEAGKLVSLPKGDAIESVALTIARMPKSVWTLLDATTIAARLVTLLPTRLGDAQPRPSIDNRRRVARFAGIGLILMAVAFVMASTLGLFTANQAGKFDGSDVSTMTPATPPSAPTN